MGQIYIIKGLSGHIAILICKEQVDIIASFFQSKIQMERFSLSKCYFLCLNLPIYLCFQCTGFFCHTFQNDRFLIRCVIGFLCDGHFHSFILIHILSTSFLCCYCPDNIRWIAIIILGICDHIIVIWHIHFHRLILIRCLCYFRDFFHISIRLIIRISVYFIAHRFFYCIPSQCQTIFCALYLQFWCLQSCYNMYRLFHLYILVSVSL